MSYSSPYPVYLGHIEAFLLRCEGLTYQEIGARLRISKPGARQKVIRGAARLRQAMRFTKFRWVESSDLIDQP